MLENNIFPHWKPGGSQLRSFCFRFWLCLGSGRCLRLVVTKLWCRVSPRHPGFHCQALVDAQELLHNHATRWKTHSSYKQPCQGIQALEKGIAKRGTSRAGGVLSHQAAIPSCCLTVQ